MIRKVEEKVCDRTFRNGPGDMNMISYTVEKRSRDDQIPWL